MIRSALSKVMWVGRATVFMAGLAVILALVFGVATTALAHSGVDTKLFHLGHSNSATTPTSLVSSLADAAKSALIVNNRSGGAALELRVGNATTPANSVAPMRVNSNKVVTNLNADQVDGKNSNEFVPNSGETTFSVFGPWISGDPSVMKAEQRFNTTHFTYTAPEPGQRYIQLSPSLPSSLYGKSMLLTGVELCYNTSDERVTLGQVSLIRESSMEPGSSSGSYVASENSPPDGAFCRTFSGTPLLMGTNSYAVLQVRVDWSAQTAFYIQRATFFLQPSNSAAAPL